MEILIFFLFSALVYSWIAQACVLLETVSKVNIVVHGPNVEIIDKIGITLSASDHCLITGIIGLICKGTT